MDNLSRPPENIRKIAVLRANGIGDFIFTLPALEALRTAYPQAEIVLLGLQWHADFLDGRPGPVDRVVVIPDIHGVILWEVEEDPAEIRRFYTAMQREGFDLALQMHGGGRYSNRLIRNLGARYTAGTKTPDAPALDRWAPYNYFQLEILRHLETVALVDAKPVTLEPVVQVTAQDLAEARQALPPTGHSLVVMHPGAGDGRRRWPPEKFAAVGDVLAQSGAQVGLIGTDCEREIVAQVLERMQAPAENLCDRLSLGGLAGLLSGAELVISNDSGPLHLASAAGAATVGIYWCGNLITAGPVTTTRHRTAISWRLECPQCGANCIHNNCDHHVSFVQDVSVEEVLNLALDLLPDGYE